MDAERKKLVEAENEARKQWDAADKQLDEAHKQLVEAENEAYKQWAAADKQLDAARKQWDAAYQQLADYDLNQKGNN